MRPLAGMSVVVTGAGRGLGRAYALDAASHGARLVVNDVDGDKASSVAAEIERRGGTAAVALGSVAEWEQARLVVERCLDLYGRIDGLVNNAAVIHACAPWDETEHRLRTIVEVNVLGSLHCGVHALRAMREQGRGSVVNVVSGALLGLPDLAAYGTTKGAVLSMTYCWALEASDAGVRVNAVSPIARTRMTERWAFAATDQPSPDAIAPLVSFLLSDRAERVTGQVVRFDGRALSLLRKPCYSDQRVECERWTFEEIVAAFEAGALGEPSPLGMVRQESEGRLGRGATARG